MSISQNEIAEYLEEIKIAVSKDMYRIIRSNKRQANQDLFMDYVIDEAKAKEILLSLEVKDFSETRQNEHIKYKDEVIYIFGKNVRLLERFGSKEKTVPLYIKFNKLENDFVIVISFHEQLYPIRYYFK